MHGIYKGFTETGILALEIFPSIKFSTCIIESQFYIIYMIIILVVPIVYFYKIFVKAGPYDEIQGGGGVSN